MKIKIYCEDCMKDLTPSQEHIDQFKSYAEVRREKFNLVLTHKENKECRIR